MDTLTNIQMERQTVDSRFNDISKILDKVQYLAADT